MATPELSEVWFDAIAKVAATIEGVQATFAGGRGGQGDQIQPMIDEPLEVTPAVVLGYGGAEVLAASWEGTKHTIEGAVWIHREPISVGFAEAIAFVERIGAAFPLHAKAFNVESRLQSLILMTIGRITPRTWPEGSDRQFLTLPFTLEAQFRQARVYGIN